MQLDELFNELPKFLQSPNPDIYWSDNYVVLDFETTNLDKGDPNNPTNSIVCAAWRRGICDGERNNVVQCSWGNEYQQGILVQDIERADFIVAHNAKFELGWLERCGVDISRVLVWDTMIADYVLAGNRNWELNLEACLKRRGYGGKVAVIKKLMENGVCPSEMPMDWLEKYGKKDVEDEYKLFLAQREELSRMGLLPVMFTRCIFTPVLADLEKRGMHLDKERVENVHNKYTKEANSLKVKFDAITGGINPKSTPQMREFLYETLKFQPLKDYRGNLVLTDSGKLPTDAQTLDKLKATNARQRAFVETRKALGKLMDAKSKYLDKFLDCVNETDDHILYANFNQTLTGTQRLSSTGKKYKTQFQNFNRNFKPLISPRHPGWKMGEHDEAQLEYRVAVFLGQDVAGLRSIIDHVDRHAITASIIFREDWEACGRDKKSAVGKRARQEAKSHTFKPLYGGQSGTDREREYYQAFKEEHIGITAAQEEWKREVLRTKSLRTVTGLIFYWPDTKVTSSGYITNSTAICNYPVQSFATADIVPIGVTYQWHRMRAANMQSFLVNTVHDSSIGEIHPEEIELYEQIGVKALTDDVIHYLKAVYKIDFNVPLEAEFSASDFWSDSEDWRKEYLS